jgi:predicted glycosyltransferase
MQVWIDLTNSPHVLVMRPVIATLRAEGHEVRVTARRFAQTVELLERFGIEHEVIGRHRGGRLGAKAAGLLARSAALTSWARRRTPGAGRPGRLRGGGPPFDLALGHGSNDVTVAAALLGIPCSTMFDYEHARVQHHINCRLADAVVVPRAIPPERLRRYGAEGKLARYDGLKEEYYLADFTPDSAVLDELSLERGRPLVVVRTPPEVALYHRFAAALFSEVLELLRDTSRRRGTQVVVLPRTPAQRTAISAHPELVVPRHAIDAQSLIAHAGLVISGGGTMNREAVALGRPVLSTFEGRLGAVDEALIAEGRLRRLTEAAQLVPLLQELAPLGESQARAGVPPERRRDVQVLVGLLLSPLGPRRAGARRAGTRRAGTM